MENKRSSLHVPVLDGFRGLAILMVIAMHYTSLRAGWIGVDLFFVLSGYLITWKLKTSPGGWQYYGRFYSHRILRIVPLFMLTLLFVFFVFPALFPSLLNPSYRELLHIQGWYWSFTQNFYNAFYGWPSNISILHFWSLGTEMQFYLLWPFVIRIAYRHEKRLIKLLLLLVVFAIVFRCMAQEYVSMTNLYRYVLLPSRIDAFALGALLYLLLDKYAHRLRRLLLPAGLVMGILLLVLYTSRFNIEYGAWFTSRIGYTLFDITWCIWLGYGLLHAGHNQLTGIFTSRIMTNIGKYSYAMYVFHLPVYTLINRLLENRYGEHVSNNLPVAIGVPLAVFAIVYLLSIASYHGFEKYFLKLKRY